MVNETIIEFYKSKGIESIEELNEEIRRGDKEINRTCDKCHHIFEIGESYAIRFDGYVLCLHCIKSLGYKERMNEKYPECGSCDYYIRKGETITSSNTDKKIVTHHGLCICRGIKYSVPVSEKRQKCGWYKQETKS